MDFPDKNIS